MQFTDLHIPSINVPRDLDLVKSTTVTSSASKKKSAITATAGAVSKCACLHPCDLEEFYNLVDTTRTVEQNRPNIYSNTILMTSNEVSHYSDSDIKVLNSIVKVGIIKMLELCRISHEN